MERRPQASRTFGRRVLQLVLVGALLLGAGFVAGWMSSADVGAPPAIGIARQLGVALPEPQIPAFADGIITPQEIIAAHDRFSTCVELAGFAEGFSSVLESDGSMRISIATPVDAATYRAVEQCRIEHVAATRDVFAWMESHAAPADSTQP